MTDKPTPAPPPEPTAAQRAAARLPPIGSGPPGPPDPPPPPHPPHPPASPPPPPPPPPPAPPPPPTGPITSSITSWTRLEPRCRDARDEHEHERARVRSAVVADAPVADRRVPGRGCGLAGDGARARDERAAVALPSRRRCRRTRERRRRPTTRALCRSKRSSSGAACVRSMRAIRACSPTLSRPGCTSCACSSRSRCRRAIAPRSSRNSRCRRRRPRRATASTTAPPRFARSMLGRAPDARRLAAAFRDANALAQLLLDPVLNIAPGDRAEVQQTAPRGSHGTTRCSASRRLRPTMRGIRSASSTRCRCQRACPHSPPTRSRCRSASSTTADSTGAPST